MNKKSLFGLFAMGALLFTASCQEEDVVKQAQENTLATVSINVTTPELGVATRAFGDGTTAKRLHYAVYNVKEEAAQRTRTYLPNLTVDGEHEINLSTTVDLQLVTGNTYDVIFWADADNEDNIYTLDWTTVDNPTVSVDYSEVTSNNEGYDAFFGKTTIVVDGSKTTSVTLKRPFAQLNIGTSDIDEAKSAGYEVAQTQVFVESYSTLHLWENGKGIDVAEEVSNPVTVEFKKAAIPARYDESTTPATGERFPLKEKKADGTYDYVEGYDYLAMNYLLRPADKDLVEVKFNFFSTSDEEKNRTYSSIPVRRNWRTNVYGQLITSDVDVNVTIDPYFEDENPDDDEKYDILVWDGHSITQPQAFDYDLDGDYDEVHVYNGSELAYIANKYNGGGQSNAQHAPATRDGESEKYDENIVIKLMNNIDLGGENWTPIQGFKGTFDGWDEEREDNFVISNLYVRTEGKAPAGLFAAARNVKNLTVKDADIKGQYKAGVIAGDGLCGKFENCHVENAKVVVTPYNNNDANNVGGIVGYLSAEPTAYVKNCSVKNAEITAYRKVGGIVGAATGSGGKAEISGNTVENVTVTADQSAEYSEDKPLDAGEIVGWANPDATVVENNTVGEGVEVITVIKDGENFLSQVQVEGANVSLVAGTYTFPGSKIAAGVTINCEEGTVFEGTSKLNINGATVIGATFSNPDGTAADQTINGTFQNCTFEGVNGLRWAYAGETCVFENCVFSGSTYGAHFDGGANDILFKNCTFSGFNAFGGAVELVTFDNCVFKSNGKSSYNGANLWGSTTMINTKFEFDGSAATEWIDCISKDKNYEFTGCTLNGGSILNTEYINSRNVDTKITIDGIVYTQAEGGYLVREEDGVAVVTTVSAFEAAIANKEIATIALQAGEYDVDINHNTSAKTISSLNANDKAVISGKFVANKDIYFENVDFKPSSTSTKALSKSTYGSYVNGSYAAIVTVNKVAASFEGCSFTELCGDVSACAINYFQEATDKVLKVNNCSFSGKTKAIYSKVLCEITNSTFDLNGGYPLYVWPRANGNGICTFTDNTAVTKAGAWVALLSQTAPYKNVVFNVQGNEGEKGYTFAWTNAARCATDGSVTFADGSAKFEITSDGKMK